MFDVALLFQEATRAERRFRRNALLAIAATAALGFWGCVDACVEKPHPTDAELITRLQTRRAEFERLRHMILEDRGLEEVRLDRTSPEDPRSVGVSRARSAEYRSRLDALDLSGVCKSEPGEQVWIWFYVSEQGFVTHGSSKSIVHVPGGVGLTERDLVSQLDTMTKARKGHGWRRVEPDWYLNFEGD